MSPCLKERVWGKEYPSGLRAKTTFAGAYHVTFRMSFFGLRKVMWDDPCRIYLGYSILSLEDITELTSEF